LTPLVTADGEAYEDGWIVAAARDDGVDPVHEVTYRGHSQHLSLVTGQRVGGPPLLYAPLTQRLDRVVPARRVSLSREARFASAPTWRLFLGDDAVRVADARVESPLALG
jgi:hypothetical protein